MHAMPAAGSRASGSTRLAKVRPYLFYDTAVSLCTECLRRIEAKLVIEGGRVWMYKWCPAHGSSKVLIATDADYWRAARETWIKPPEMPRQFNTPMHWGCPYDCSFCSVIKMFGRKLRKYESVLAGEASARFARLLDDHAAFDARVSQLPTERDVVDYFRWRHEDAHRNALQGHCYWLLRSQGLTDRAATRRLEGRSIAERNELLFQHGIQFNDVPAWQKRGVGLFYRDVEHVGRDGRDGSEVVTTRRRLHVELELPLGMAYSAFVRQRIEEAVPATKPVPGDLAATDDPCSRSPS